LNFQQQNSLKNQYQDTLALKIVNKLYEIWLAEGFLRTSRTPPNFQYSFQFQFYLLFIEKVVQ
jgi:hypothetical protein